MFGIYILGCVTHFGFTILILKSLNFLLPSYITSYYFQVSGFLLCVIIAKFTFGFTKKLLFRGKVHPNRRAVLITGCARGIGKLIAKRLDSEGYDVFASCRNVKSPGADDLRESCSNRLKVFELDVTKDESVEKAAQFVKDNLGTSELWAIVNNGGIQKGFLTELTTLQDYKDTMEVNAIGQVRVTKAFLPLLRKSRGRVVNIASIAGRVALPMCGAYTMSKYASVGFSENLRIELDMWGIRVVSVEPELFETDLVKGENIMMRVDDAFVSVNEEVRKDYGENFLRKFKELTGKAFPPSPNIHKVIDDIECAVSLKNPNAVYRTCRNVFVELFFYWYIACPPECKVFLANTYYRIMGLPKPEKSNKISEMYSSY